MSSTIYLLLALALYAVGAIHVLTQALTRRRLLTGWVGNTTVAGFAIHTAAISQRWTEAGHFPAVGLHDGSSLLAWATMLVFVMAYVRTRVEALGLVVYPAAFALVLVANLTSGVRAGDPSLRTVFLPVHATLAFFGYAALFLAFAMGLGYIIQERQLKSRAPRAFYYLGPSLERCDTLGGTSVRVGFVFLTLAIITGLLYSHHARGRYWTGDPKEWSAVVGWLIYVSLIVARHRQGWGGRRGAMLGIVGFVVVVFTFVWMTLGVGHA